MIKIVAFKEGDEILGAYDSSVAPRHGELLDANNGTFLVTQVQHDIRGSLASNYGDETRPKQTAVVVHVRKI